MDEKTNISNNTNNVAGSEGGSLRCSNIEQMATAVLHDSAIELNIVSGITVNLMPRLSIPAQPSQVADGTE